MRAVVSFVVCKACGFVLGLCLGRSPVAVASLVLNLCPFLWLSKGRLTSSPHQHYQRLAMARLCL